MAQDRKTSNPDTSTTTNLRLCVVLPTWVGDACMATPTLRSLRAGFPDANITVVMRPILQELLEGSWGGGAAWWDHVVHLRKGRQGIGHSRLSVARYLRQHRQDVAVLLTNSLWSAAALRLAGCHRVVGYDRDARGWLLHDRLPVLRQGRKLTPQPAIDYYLAMAHYLGCDTTDRRMQLATCDQETAAADSLWTQIGFSKERPTLAINSGAATDATRKWPAAKIQQLALSVANDLGWQVILHCGPGDRDESNRLAAQLRHPRIASMGVAANLPIGLSKAVLQRSSLIVSTDSGPRHIGVALDKSVITLYGPTTPAWTTTYNQPETPLTAKKLSGSSHMADIAVTDVMQAIQTLVDKHAAAVVSQNAA